MPKNRAEWSSIILMYDAGRTIYAAFESSIQAIIDRIVTHSNIGSEEEEEKYA